MQKDPSKSTQRKPLDDVKVLIVDDEDLLAWSLDSELKAIGAVTERTASLQESLQKFPEFLPDVTILDLRLSDGDGMELLKKWNHEAPDMPVILITAHGAIDSAINALRLGAFDYLRKPFEMRDLIISVKKAAEIALLRQRVKSYSGLEKPIDDLEIIGEHASMDRLRSALKRIAMSKADTVLIYGESGTGKELAARAVHRWSDRNTQPFVEINCASIPENLLESELFGYEKGAFTDARDRKFGLFETAKNGTIFLDEIGELPYGLQAKLLRALEYRRFRRLGGTKDIHFTARIVAATNKYLIDEAAKGEFREDLYYRLDVLSLTLPPLRERLSDIPVLCQFFLKSISKEYELKKPKMDPKTTKLLMSHYWPGNVRELRNLLLRALTLYEPDVLKPEHIEIRRSTINRQTGQDLQPDTQPQMQSPSKSSSRTFFKLPDEGISLEEVEKSLVVQALEKSLFSKSKAASLLGISRHTLRYRMDKFGIEP